MAQSIFLWIIENYLAFIPAKNLLNRGYLREFQRKILEILLVQAVLHQLSFIII